MIFSISEHWILMRVTACCPLIRWSSVIWDEASRIGWILVLQRTLALPSSSSWDRQSKLTGLGSLKDHGRTQMVHWKDRTPWKGQTLYTEFSDPCASMCVNWQLNWEIFVWPFECIDVVAQSSRSNWKMFLVSFKSSGLPPNALTLTLTENFSKHFKTPNAQQF